MQGCGAATGLRHGVHTRREELVGKTTQTKKMTEPSLYLVQRPDSASLHWPASTQDGLTTHLRSVPVPEVRCDVSSVLSSLLLLAADQTRYCSALVCSIGELQSLRPGCSCISPLQARAEAGLAADAAAAASCSQLSQCCSPSCCMQTQTPPQATPGTPHRNTITGCVTVRVSHYPVHNIY